VNHKTVQAVYIDEHNSIVKNLPIPAVGICNKAAYIPAREIINHLLAIGMFFCAGHEEDWVEKSGNYATKLLTVIFIRMFHSQQRSQWVHE
jgi:hypothetical protein